MAHRPHTARREVGMFSREQLEQLQSPCFIFDEKELRSNFTDFTTALREKWSRNAYVGYSVKTNPFPWVLEIARDCGCYAEVVSDDEYHLALRCGFSPTTIIFNGPVKGREWFDFAIKRGSVVNIDSSRELRWVREIAGEGIDPINVGVRVNIDLEKYCPGQTIGGDEPGRFGFSYEDGEAGRVIAELKSISNVDIAGLHMHVTTYGRLPRAYEVLSSFAAKIIEEYDIRSTLRYVDMGGGYYGGGIQNAGRYEEYANIIAKTLSPVCDASKVTLFVEPGGAVVCTPGYYLGRVVDAKDVRGQRFVVTELSRLNIDHEMKKTAYAHVLYTSKTNSIDSQILCGFTCMESDRLCELTDEAELLEGDLILIKYAGAYSMSFTPGFFIEHAPAVYSYDSGEFAIRRELFSEVPEG